MGEILKIGIVGSRDFPDLTRVSAFVRHMYSFHGKQLEIVSGGARGVDKTAEDTGRELGLVVTSFHPDPKVKPFFKAAHARNTLIVDHSDWVYAFYSMSPASRGTIDSMHKAVVARKLVAIYTPLDAFQSTRVVGPA